jgi:hypothetical protein
MFTPNYASPEQLQGAAETTATDVYSLGAVLHKILTGYSPSENTESLTSLPIDLQYILRKALRTEPEERYDSAEALANDLRAFLEWKPVQARSGDTWYRARQFVRRYRVPVLATALLIAGLSVGLYAVNRERRIAQRLQSGGRGLMPAGWEWMLNASALSVIRRAGTWRCSPPAHATVRNLRGRMELPV